ncbi:hypothetical protein THAOC_06316 [Thalassiosira oceanica]|uniref:Uncharacterized protein n=1 Tax=Thalassiosira oceanica TaxID=159749 RepID=K0T511_THAOC|nr:hypothetical protein THAOC_06316 [Thalassiosira oceanica]|eukprot:EJK72179.1 hypothetical protein THAOC_06316 [Thalassiosira oceanica]
MEDVDSSSSDESSDESMNDNVQMTSDTSSHSKLSGMLTDKLEVVNENVKSALQHLILRTLNGTGDGSYSMPVCVVCDQLIIGVEEVCSISKEILQKNNQRLSWPTFESFCDRTLPEALKRQYRVEDPYLKELILSPRSICTDDLKSYNGCKACRNALRGKSNQKRSTPPTKAIANGNIFGQVPEDVVASIEFNDGSAVFFLGVMMAQFNSLNTNAHIKCVIGGRRTPSESMIMREQAKIKPTPGWGADMKDRDKG